MKSNPFFPEISGRFGFGCMRLPMKDGKVDYEEFCRMADAFIEGGPLAAMAEAQVMKSLPNAKGCSMPADTLDEILCAPFAISNVEQAGLGVEIDWSKLG